MGEIEMGWNFNSVKTILNILGTFALTTIAWIFFRAKSISEAIGYIQKMVTEASGGILQVLHAEGANGLHDVGTHATQGRFQVFTKWRLHLRYSF